MNIDNDNARAAIVKHLKDNPDQRFTLASLSRLSGMSQANIKQTMPELGGGFKSERSVTNAISYYYTEKQFTPKAVKPFTPLKVDAAMNLAIARCRADRGGEFHPISIS
jgi:hypothetical protein